MSLLKFIQKKQQGGSFRDAWQAARDAKQRYFNFNGRTYNSKDVGNDTAWQGFTDNLEQVSAQLKSSAPGTHLGWNPGPNNAAYEQRGSDRLDRSRGTNATTGEVVVTGHRISKPTRQTSTRKNDDWQATAGQSRMHQLQELQRNADQVNLRMQNDHFLSEVANVFGLTPGEVTSNANKYIKVWKDPKTGKSYRYYTKNGINYIEGGRWWNHAKQQGGRYRFDGWKRFVPFIDNYTYF